MILICWDTFIKTSSGNNGPVFCVCGNLQNVTAVSDKNWCALMSSSSVAVTAGIIIATSLISSFGFFIFVWGFPGVESGFDTNGLGRRNMDFW